MSVCVGGGVGGGLVRGLLGGRSEAQGGRGVVWARFVGCVCVCVVGCLCGGYQCR
jgi:hypothetical protein